MNHEAEEPARVVRGLLRLYPAGWRARFADEFGGVLVAVLAGGGGGGGARWRARLRVVLDVVVGAVDAHLHRSFEPGRKPTPDRVRTSAQVAFCAFVVFCVAGTGFQKMTEDLRFQAAAEAHATIGRSFDVVAYGVIAAALCVVAGSLPVLLGIARQALAGRRDLRRLLVIPLVAVVGWIGLVRAAVAFDNSPRHSLVNAVAVLGVIGAFAVAVTLSAGALVAATRRADLPAAVKRVQWLPMTGLSVAMVAVTAGDLVWGLTLEAQAPDLFHSDNGLLATSMPATWAATLAVMGLASAVALAATARAIGAVWTDRGPPRAAATD